MAARVEEILRGLGLSQYLKIFFEAGFEDWESLREIQEIDFLKLSVRRGDRRKLQREIARRHLWPDLQPLPTTEDLRHHENLISRRSSVASYSRSISRPCSYSPKSLTSTSLPPSPDTRRSGSRVNAHGNTYDYSDIRDHIATILRDKSIILDIDNNQNSQSPVECCNERGRPRNSRPEASFTASKIPEFSESLVHQVCHALSSPTPSSDKLSQDQLFFTLSEAERSTRQFTISPRHGIHLDAFIQRLNHVLHLFDEFSLRGSFENAVAGQALDEVSSTELTLALALGATYTGTQPHSVHLEMYIRGRVQLSVLNDWRDDLWMMRVLIMIALYHLNMFPNSTSHFLDLAIRLGQANRLDAASFPLPDVVEPARSHWLRVWKSIEFVQQWLHLGAHNPMTRVSETEYLINMLEPPLISEECLNSRLTQLNMSVLGNLLKEVLQDRVRSELGTPSPSLVAVHLGSLSRFYSELPIYFYLRPRPDNETAGISRFIEGTNARQKSSILNVHVLYLGVKCQLLQPALVKMLQTTQGDEIIVDHASQCVESARMIVEICEDIVKSGFGIKGHWVVVHFLSKVLLILILASIQAHKENHIEVWKKMVDSISTAARLLEISSDGSPAGGSGIDVVDQFSELLESG